jgi:4-hydroxy-3-methylbut-2-enyl diphosphate reductase
MSVTKVLLAEPRGFCAGVEKAIKALAWMVRVFEPPIYCYHEIVHNQLVVERFRKLGVVFVDTVDQVPPGAPVMLSAHGTAPAVVTSSQEAGRISINAVCPLVTKVHHEVKVRSQRGYEIIYIGHRGHDEAVGTVAVAPESVHLIEDEHDLRELDRIDGPVALVAQTTLSMDEWAEVRQEVEREYSEIWMPTKSDLCFATTNRQGALKEIAQRADVVVVLGSSNSSNTVALEKVARSRGVTQVFRVNSASELPRDLAGVVGVTAGASAPDELVDEVIASLNPTHGVEVVHYTAEEEYFPPPPELRDFLRSLSALLKVALASPLPYGTALEDDASVSASRTLMELNRDLSESKTPR